MNIAVCDKSPADREIITDFLHHYFSDKSIQYKISEFESGANLVYEFEDSKNFDVVFLDAYVGELLGIEVARKLRKLHYSGDIVFLTESPEYALEGYEVEASAYILKPHSNKKICSTMERIVSKYNINTYDIKQRNNIIRVPFNEIMFIESNNSKCTLHRCDGRSYIIYKHLCEIEAELTDRRFLRCHQSYIVNMNYIIQADRHFVMKSGDIVMIRQRNLNEIKKEYFRYINKYQ